jgi:hypothetical protein
MQIPNAETLLFAVMETETTDFIKKESCVSNCNSWSKIDTVEWLTHYGANKEQAESIDFANAAELLSMLNSNPEGYAKILCMATSALQQACKSIENSAHPAYMQPGPLYVNGKFHLRFGARLNSSRSFRTALVIALCYEENLYLY